MTRSSSTLRRAITCVVGCLLLASCALTGGDDLAGPPLSFCDAMGQPVDFGVIDPRDAIGHGDFDEVVEIFQRGDDRVDVIVWIRHDASDDEIASVRAAAEAIPYADVVSFTDKAEALAEFRANFDDNAAIQAAVNLEDMPTSLRLDLDDMDANQLRQAPYELEALLDDSGGPVWEIIGSPAVNLAPTELAAVTIADLLLEAPLRPELVLTLHASASAEELLSAEQAVAATGARYGVYDKAETFAEFQALHPGEARYDVNDMAPSVRVEQAPGLEALRDAIPFESIFTSELRDDDEALLGEFEGRIIEALTEHPDAKRLLAHARVAAPDLADGLAQLAEDPAGGNDADQYAFASSLRDRLVDECGQAIRVSDQRRPLFDLMTRVQQLDSATG